MKPKHTPFRNFLFDGPRICSSCRQPRPRDGGTMVPIDGGRRQKWVCADCTKRDSERKAA